MNTILRRLAFVAALTASGTAFAQAPPLIPVQGFVTDNEGTPRDGEATVDMVIYTAATGGDVLHSESQVIDLDTGYFAAEIGLASELDLSVFREQGEAWVELTIDGETLSPRLPLDTVPYAAWADYAGEANYAAEAGDAATVGGLTPDDIAAPDWDAIEGVPEGLVTAADFGDGLVAGEDGVTVDYGAVQARVIGTCEAGDYVTAINEDGSVTCDAGADYDAGAGLTLTDGTFAVDYEAVQARIGDGCSPGQVVTAIGADGTITCADDADTTYDAGDGLDLVDGFFSVDYDAVQAALDTMCPPGQFVTGFADGTPMCAPDNDTTYGAGLGLTLSAGFFSINTAFVQQRVSGACPAGQSIRAIAADGTVTCEIDDAGTGDITGVTAGAGLTGGGASGAVTLAADTAYLQRRVTGTCPAGQSIRSIAANGTVTCEADDVGVDTDTTYTAGTGLNLTDTTFRINPAITQQRVTGTCPAGQSIRAIAQDGTVTCEPDDVGGSGLAASASGNVSFTMSESTFNYGMLPTTYVPAADGVCHVSITFQVSGLPTTSTSSTFVRTAWQVDGTNSDDSTYGLYVGAQAGTTYSTPITMTSTRAVTAGRTYRFGCAPYGSGDFRGRSANCRVSWTCF